MSIVRRRFLLKTIAGLPLAAAPATPAEPGVRPWLGPEFWANPLQDWRLRDSRFECHSPGGDRNVYWLTRGVSSPGKFSTSVRLGRLDAAPGDGWAGFRIGVKSYFPDYRDAAIRGIGLDAGITADGRLFIGSKSNSTEALPLDTGGLTLTLQGDQTKLELSAGGRRVTLANPPAEWLSGGVALVCHSGAEPSAIPRLRMPSIATPNKSGTQRGGAMRVWFADWKLEGAAATAHPDRAWGPLLFNQYTLSRGVLKMLVQLAPVDDPAAPPLELRVNNRTVATAPIDALSATALLRVDGWNDSTDTPYEVAWGSHRLRGVIRRNPVHKEKIVAAALTCQNDFGFPHEDIARNLEHLNPDILFFTGDQVYERNGEYSIQREPLEAARLDYLRKWYMFGWAWGGLTREIPCVCIPDDHDVYHGNVWGAGGRKAEYPSATLAGGANPQQEAQDSGGFCMPSRWVNMVQRTQCLHLPDGDDRELIEQGLTVHFCQLVWGGVSFAILEDRKWKTAPRTVLPQAKIRNGWAQDPEWDARQGDVAGAQLLGARQERFLARWAQDWSGGVWMKCAVSPTIFANLATLPASMTSDAGTPKIPIQPLGGYAPDDRLTADHDSNGWPQTPRNRALRLLRSCLAVHIAGDQHLASTLQYGIDDFNDAPYAICTPAVSNLFPRRWFPPAEGANRKTGAPRNMGEYLDGFGNRMTVHAVANPQQFGQPPEALHNLAVGYGVIEFEKSTRKITLTNWPRWARLDQAGARPYDGWPLVIHQLDNGLSSSVWKIDLPRPVNGLVQVLDAKSNEVAYTLRLPAPTRTLPVWQPGAYRVRLPEGGQEIDGLSATRKSA